MAPAEEPLRIFIGDVSWDLTMEQASEALDTMLRGSGLAYHSLEVAGWARDSKRPARDHDKAHKGFGFVSIEPRGADLDSVLAVLRGLPCPDGVMQFRFDPIRSALPDRVAQQQQQQLTPEKLAKLEKHRAHKKRQRVRRPCLVLAPLGGKRRGLTDSCSPTADAGTGAPDPAARGDHGSYAGDPRLARVPLWRLQRPPSPDARLWRRRRGVPHRLVEGPRRHRPLPGLLPGGGRMRQPKVGTGGGAPGP